LIKRFADIAHRQDDNDADFGFAAEAGEHEENPPIAITTPGGSFNCAGSYSVSRSL
jgi:hypothetical protein